ncbi:MULTISPECIES: LysR family transcriptional regulator [unclassified Yoonia]|uniref:LysR family transcriptional regulator n=1 Tax=unclassified Yoonia TaxID=2629118 RepID=UPI002AFED43A|nr:MULTISPECIES: LysR family transcriptional regulator [unclassified Yoonia]
MDRSFDWNRIRGFLAVAEGGSLSAGARRLGLTQPTLGRQITALEQELGLDLFMRAGRGLTLTQSGADLLVHVRAMGEAADRIALAAAGQTQDMTGRVRITASDLMSAERLPAALRRIRDLAPQLEVELVAANDIRNLNRREADIAVRHQRPDQPNLIARRLPDGEARLYASPDYLARHPAILTPDDLKSHDFISYGDTTRMAEHLQKRGFPVGAAQFRYVSENGSVAWALCQEGLGILPIDIQMARACPDMRLILPDHPPILFPVWLVTHEELHTSPRIRLVFDVLADHLAA